MWAETEEGNCRKHHERRLRVAGHNWTHVVEVLSIALKGHVVVLELLHAAVVTILGAAPGACPAGVLQKIKTRIEYGKDVGATHAAVQGTPVDIGTCEVVSSDTPIHSCKEAGNGAPTVLE